ncbi:glycosyltransferase family 4 protein [Desulfonatronum parangueonense]
MRIGFDISQTGQGRAGCGHYAASLLQALLTLNRDDEFLLYPRFNPAVWDDSVSFRGPSDEERVRNHFLAENRGELVEFWRSDPDHLAMSLGKPDVLHANSYSCPPLLPGCRLVYTLYDLSFLDHPEWTTPENWWNCLSGVLDAAFFADRIVSISAYSRERFLDVFPFFPRERIHIAHPASRLSFPEGETPQNSVPFDLTPGAFWLGVGTLEPRKNHVRLLKAYASLLERHPTSAPLVLAGGRGWLTQELDQELNRTELSGRVRVLGYVSDQELTWLYRHCLGFVYPSLDEGFGMPVLEAMNLGAAVITSNVAALPEVAGDAALLVDPLDMEQLVQTMLHLAENPALRAEMGRKGRIQAEAFSWSRSAEIVRQAYFEAMTGEKRTSPVSQRHLRQWWLTCSFHLRDQIQAVFEQWRQSETDREARLKVVKELGDRLTVSESDREARLRIINDLGDKLAASEADREARLQVIHDLQSRIHSTEMQRQVFQDRLQALESNLLIRGLRKLKILRCGSGQYT